MQSDNSRLGFYSSISQLTSFKIAALENEKNRSSDDVTKNQGRLMT